MQKSLIYGNLAVEPLASKCSVFKGEGNDIKIAENHTRYLNFEIKLSRDLYEDFLKGWTPSL